MLLVGGEVTLVRPKRDLIEIVVHGHKGSERYQICAVTIPRDTGHDIQPGDEIWWQGNRVMWTPKAQRGEAVEEVDGVLVGSGAEYDIVIPRVGFSYDPKP